MVYRVWGLNPSCLLERQMASPGAERDMKKVPVRIELTPRVLQTL